MVQTTGVEARGTTNDTVDFIALGHQELGSSDKSDKWLRPGTETGSQVRSILASDTWVQSAFIARPRGHKLYQR